VEKKVMGEPKPVQHIADSVFFRMPKDRELLCAAITAVQAFVNTYKEKATKANIPGAMYHLLWDWDLSPEDWALYESLKLILVQKPQQLYRIDMLVDMSTERALSYISCHKHAVQIYGLFCGTLCPAVPVIRQVKPGLVEGHLKIGLSEDCLQYSDLTLQLAEPVEFSPVIVESLAHAEDWEYSCVLGHASELTYLAAAMGLPVVEILPEGRPTYWLSKWANSGYRVVEPGLDEARQISTALISIREVVNALLLKQSAKTRVNSDDTYNVLCSSCSQFIATTAIPIQRALCELCQRALDGKPVPEEAYRRYQLSKLGREDVSMLLVPPPVPGQKKFSFRNLGGQLIESIGLKKKTDAPVPSKQLAKAKQRARLFADVELGNMEDLDKTLRDKEQGK
jgi:hypothetical protein